jgi:hypothetical protein
MGRYQQWLHYKEADQQLRVRLEQLEGELAQAKERARQLEEKTAALGSEENVIIQALLRPPVQALSPVQEEAIQIDNALPANRAEATNETVLPSIPVSPALFAWSRLPNFDSQKMQVLQGNEGSPATIPSTPHSESDLLPLNLEAFFPEETLPTPLLHQEMVPSTPNVSQVPVDRQAKRTDRLVQRWLERWGKTTSEPEAPQKDQEP